MNKGLIDCIISVQREKVSGLGEDSAFSMCRKPLSVMAVFDGCGGIGAKKYPEMNNNTGAYIASKTAAKASEKWFCEAEDLTIENAEGLALCLNEHLKDGLGKLSQDENRLKGSLVCSFPTTAAVVLAKELNGAVLSAFFWAGDSRGYIFEPKGLVQITKDHISGKGDAFDNLREDARLSNFARAESDFYLEYKTAEITSSAMLICATDGCFGYFKTPMEFEYMLLKTMEKAESFSHWGDLITAYLTDISGDDLAMYICPVGINDIEQAKKIYEKRSRHLYKKYISKIDGAKEETLKKLWESYKKEYYG